jgi:hypothetical protein
MSRASTGFPTGLAVVLATVALSASACGGGGGPRAELLRSANPLTSDLYLRIKGPPGAVSQIAEGATTGAFSRYHVGAFVPPKVRRHKACSFTHTIDVADAPNLQKWRGKKATLIVYGNSAYATTYCLGIAGAFGSGS